MTYQTEQQLEKIFFEQFVQMGYERIHIQNTLKAIFTGIREDGEKKGIKRGIEQGKELMTKLKITDLK